LLANGSVNTEANARNIIRVVFSVVIAELIATRRCGKHISAAVDQQATIEEAVFSMGSTSRLYNEDIRQL
jgi:hypothetical protein